MGHISFVGAALSIGGGTVMSVASSVLRGLSAADGGSTASSMLRGRSAAGRCVDSVVGAARSVGGRTAMLMGLAVCVPYHSIALFLNNG